MKALTIIFGVLLILGGILCVANPGLVFLSLGLFLGIATIAGGFAWITAYVNGRKTGTSIWNLIGGVAVCLIGVFICFSQQMVFWTDAILAYSIGAIALVFGIFRIVAAFQLKKADTSKSSLWVLVLIVGILTALFGLYACFHPVLGAIAVGWLIGFNVMFSGINNLVAAFTDS